MKIFLVAVLLFLSPLFSNNITIPTSLKVQEKLSNQGQRIFRKKLQRRCGYTAGYFAQQHTIKDWKAIGNNELFRSEFNSLCPKGSTHLKESWILSLYLFSIKYARDSGEKPRC